MPRFFGAAASAVAEKRKKKQEKKIGITSKPFLSSSSASFASSRAETTDRRGVPPSAAIRTFRGRKRYGGCNDCLYPIGDKARAAARGLRKNGIERVEGNSLPPPFPLIVVPHSRISTGVPAAYLYSNVIKVLHGGLLRRFVIQCQNSGTPPWKTAPSKVDDSRRRLRRSSHSLKIIFVLPFRDCRNDAVFLNKGLMDL